VRDASEHVVRASRRTISTDAYHGESVRSIELDAWAAEHGIGLDPADVAETRARAQIARNAACDVGHYWWAIQGSNLGPHAYQLYQAPRKTCRIVIWQRFLVR